MTLETWQLGLSLIIITMPMLIVNIWWLILNRKCRNPTPFHQESGLYTGSFLAGMSAGMTDASTHQSVDEHHSRHRPGSGKHGPASPGDLP